MVGWMNRLLKRLIKVLLFDIKTIFLLFYDYKHFLVKRRYFILNDRHKILLSIIR